MKKRFSFGQKRLLRAAAMLIAALWMSAAVSAAADTKLMVVSDLHYLEPSMYRGAIISFGRCGAGTARRRSTARN